MNEYRMIKQEPLEKLILLGICGVHFTNYIEPDKEKYFSIKDMLQFTTDIKTLEDFEMNYAVNIINIVLDGEE